MAFKRGKHGAEFHSKNLSIKQKAIKVKAVNSTGAGDFFNAGFTFGKAMNYSNKASLACAVFMGAKKTGAHEYYSPQKKELEKYFESENLLELRIIKNHEALSMAIAKEIAEQLRKKPDSVLCLASGQTSLRAYEILGEMCRKKQVSFSRAYFVELDEYLGVPKEQTWSWFMKKNFFSKTNFKHKNILLFDPNPKNALEEARRMESFVQKKGIDFALLGLGENGHIAFNEPGTSFDSKTRVTSIMDSTAKKNAAKGFAGKKVVTLGLSTIMNAGKIVLATSGSGKADAAAKAFSGKPSEKTPASILQNHRNTVFIVDEKAGKKIKSSY